MSVARFLEQNVDRVVDVALRSLATPSRDDRGMAQPPAELGSRAPNDAATESARATTAELCGHLVQAFRRLEVRPGIGGLYRAAAEAPRRQCVDIRR